MDTWVCTRGMLGRKRECEVTVGVKALNLEHRKVIRRLALLRAELHGM